MSTWLKIRMLFDLRLRNRLRVSGLLFEFFAEYLAFAKGAADLDRDAYSAAGGKFNKYTAICGNLNRFLYYKCVFVSDRIKAHEELHNLFAANFENTVYPFGRSNFMSYQKGGNYHRDPNRIKFVEMVVMANRISRGL